MRALVAVILFGLALWRGYIDYTLTLGQGEAYRMLSVARVWEQISPATYETWFPAFQEADTPILWDPVLETVMRLPAALVLMVLAIFFFAIRKRRR